MFQFEDENEGLHVVDEDFSDTEISDAIFSNCIFERCSFQNAFITSCHFDNCTFKHCNVSMAEFDSVRMFDISFLGCKLLGINWSNCIDALNYASKNSFKVRYKKGFNVTFTDCLLRDNSFGGMELKHIVFSGCSLNGASFITVDLSHAKFTDCDLTNCHFEDTVLFKTDFTTATGYVINSARNKLAKAKFSLPEAISLLQNLDIELV